LPFNVKYQFCNFLGEEIFPDGGESVENSKKGENSIFFFTPFIGTHFNFSTAISRIQPTHTHAAIKTCKTETKAKEKLSNEENIRRVKQQ
jgi:hypothetical protein